MRILIAALMLPAQVHCAVLDVIQNAEYNIGDSENRVQARQSCINLAKMQVLERDGSLVESKFVVTTKESTVSVEEQSTRTTSVLTAEIVSTILISDQLTIVGDGQKISCVVKVSYDPNELRQKLKDLSDSAKLQKKIDEQKLLIYQLTAQVNLPKPPPVIQYVPQQKVVAIPQQRVYSSTGYYVSQTKIHVQ
jgi:hypothetical protein